MSPRSQGGFRDAFVYSWWTIKREERTRMKVVFAYDGSECADAAIEDLRRAGLPADAKITVLSVAENWLPPPSSLEFLAEVDRVKEYRALAERAAIRLHEVNPHWAIQAESPIGSPSSQIIEKADEWKPDLIVVGSHGRTALGRLIFGSVSLKVLHEARCSVRIARGRTVEPGTPVRLLIGIDGSKYANAAVSAVAERTWPAGTEVRLVNGMWKMPAATANQMLSEIAAWVARENARIKEAMDAAFSTLKAAGLKASVVLKDDEPRQLLVAEAESWGADSIFVGSKGMGRVERFLIGSVSSAVASRAHCSVEVIRI
jgi:nucleotide-binding universal stress UspA family protein